MENTEADPFAEIADLPLDLAQQFRREHDAPAVPERLYHYTSLKAAISILESGTLWVTDARFLNDHDELFEGVRRANPLVFNAARRVDFWSSIASLQTYPFDPFQDLRTYVGSLTTEDDDAAHWERYAQNHSGVALEFDGTAIAAHGEMNATKPNFGFAPVLYEHDKQRELVEHVIKVWEPLCKEYLASHSTSHNAALAACMSELWMTLVEYLPSMKARPWRSEREWRLGHAHRIEPHGCCSPGRHMTVYGEAEHVALGLSLSDKLPLVGVQVGARVTSDEMKQLENVLEMHGYTAIRKRGSAARVRQALSAPITAR